MSKQIKNQTEKTKKLQPKKKKWTSSPVYRTVAGGAVGAGLGYVLKPKQDKKALYTKKNASNASLKDKASDLKDSIFGDDKKKKGKKNARLFSKNTKGKKRKKKPNKKQFQLLKSENETLQQRLQFLEDKLDQYTTSKKRKKSLFRKK
ncbi:hypothetical protein [Staphylococcus simulans]|uniref:hypothetical protein n=1 Tax=Staphylococcus simulans TaxID=1286 RepID=UPI000D1D3BC2|nr:hypothetical protein [Staphylococcus simulans]PTJ24113.1 hypothetical protein BU039_02715 [Staphylococcus simulans]